MLCHCVSRSRTTRSGTLAGENVTSKEGSSKSNIQGSSIDAATTINEEWNNTDMIQSWSDWLRSNTKQPLSDSLVLEEEYIPSWKFPDEVRGLYQSSKIVFSRRMMENTHVPLAILAMTCRSSGSKRQSLRKRKVPGGYVEDLELEPTKHLDEFIKQRIQSPLLTTEVVKNSANVVKSRKIQKRRDEKKKSVHLETTASTNKPVWNKSSNRQAPVRHILLGNEATVQKENLDNHNDDQYMYFIPDLNPELHQKLTMLEVEYAWLLEESFYLYQARDETYIYNYASPHLKICFRMENVLVKPENQADFDILCQDIRRRIRQGRRRGPIMSRIMAQLRFQNRQSSATNTISLNQAINLSGGEKTATILHQPCHLLPTLNATQVAIAESATAVDVSRNPCHSGKKSSSSSKKTGHKLDKSKGTKKHERPCGSANRGNVHEDSNVSGATIQPPVSKLLTETEMEVAWLAEESSLLDPINGPFLSYIEMHASDDLKSTMSVALGASHSRRWLPRLYRGHDATIKQEFRRIRDLIRNALKQGYRRPETAHFLPREYIPPPVAIRVRQAYTTFLSSGS